LAKRRKRIALPPDPDAHLLVEPPAPAPLIDEAFITAYSNQLFEQLVGGLGALIGGNGAVGGAVEAPTTRCVIIATSVGGQFWTATRDCRILGVLGSGVGQCQLAVGNVGLYAAGDYAIDDANVVLRWQDTAIGTVRPVNYPIKSGQQLLFRSSVAANTLTVITTQV